MPRAGARVRSPSPVRAPRAVRGVVTVVVLGDWGRSPRMQYHALSLADQAGKDVHVIAYAGAAPVAAVASHAHVRLHALPPPPAFLSHLPRPLALALKALFQLAALLLALLWRTPRPTHMLLQTPPCVPTFAACQLACALRRAVLVCDWHNFGYTLLALSLRRSSLLLHAAEAYERALGRRAHAHLCVTRAMAAELARPAWGVPHAVVLHDRPASHFRRCDDASAAHELFRRLSPSLAASPAACADDWGAAEFAGACAASGRCVCVHVLMPCPSLSAQQQRRCGRPSRAARAREETRSCCLTAPRWWCVLHCVRSIARLARLSLRPAGQQHELDS